MNKATKMCVCLVVSGVRHNTLSNYIHIVYVRKQMVWSIGSISASHKEGRAMIPSCIHVGKLGDLAEKCSELQNDHHKLKEQIWAYR